MRAVVEGLPLLRRRRAMLLNVLRHHTGPLCEVEPLVVVLVQATGIAPPWFAQNFNKTYVLMFIQS